MTDPAEFDLETIKSRMALMPLAPLHDECLNLIAAVEALRERVTESIAFERRARADCQAAEAQVVELAGALKKTALAILPSRALERARGFEQLARDAVSDLRRYARDDFAARRMVSVRAYEKALANLDALNQDTGT